MSDYIVCMSFTMYTGAKHVGQIACNSMHVSAVLACTLLESGPVKSLPCELSASPGSHSIST